MKILHCCLANFYTDGYGYQENIIPKHHKAAGYNVKIIASTETYINNRYLGYTEPTSYINEDDINVTRLPYVKWLPKKIVKKLRIYSKLEKEISEFKPDVIFLHDCQFLSIWEITAYVEKNNCRVYVDSHTDFINSAKNILSKYLLHKIIYKWCAKKIEPYVTTFFGTLPIRNTFLSEVYGIDSSKIKLLEFGFDNLELPLDLFSEIRENKRNEIVLSNNDTLILAGGKFDGRKNYLELIKAFKLLNNVSCYLVLFGKPNKSLVNEFYSEIKHSNIKYLGWLSPIEISKYIIASDLMVFPGTHSVIWEQAVGAGIPCIFKKWDGIEHINLGGNCILLNNGNEAEILTALKKVTKNKTVLIEMKKAALSKQRYRFLYSEIAKKSIQE
jgi:1,2-diacylglycerol 3-alpha-glucosyltransferase